MANALIPKGELGIRTAAPPASKSNELNVALYPYVPNRQAFEDAVAGAWSALDTGFNLTFRQYDPYTGPPPPTIDVFAFDCMFTGDLVAGMFVELIPPDQVEGLDDLQPFARAATVDPSGRFAGIPYLGCCDTLFYRKDDEPLQQADLSIDRLYQILGDAKEPTQAVPQEGQGLVVELRGSTTTAGMYVQAWEQQTGSCVPEPPLPPVEKLDPGAMTALKTLVKMAGRAQAGYNDPGNDRVTWFASGLGRAMVNFTEALFYISSATRSQLALRALPLGKGMPTPSFADAVGIRPGLDPDSHRQAVRVANLIASPKVLETAISPEPAKTQYLVPARVSALRALAAQDPLYADIEAMLQAAQPCGFRLGPGAWSWIKKVGPEIASELLGIPPVLMQPPVSALSMFTPEGFESTPAGIWRRGF